MSCILFLAGCNFNCPYCHNPALTGKYEECGQHIDENRVYQFLDHRRSFLEGVVISGGEPTLQNDLIPLCERIKNMGYPIKLDTNGSRPQVLKNLMDHDLVDYIAMDIKTDPLAYSPLIKKAYNHDHILSSIWMIMESAPAYEFRTTCVKPLVTPKAIERICEIIRGADLYILQQFHESEVLKPDLFKKNKNRYQDYELDYLVSIAEPFVKKCHVRNTG